MINRRPTGLGSASTDLLLRLLLPGLLCLGSWPGAALSGAAPGSASSAPVIARGMFLVASPELGDPNFRESVILICEHSPSGTLGLIINRPTNLLLAEALPEIPALQGTAHLLFAGGPVQPDAILMLFRAARAPADTRTVFEGIHIGGSAKLIEDIVTRPASDDRFRAFAGYAGWGPGQLEGETAQGSWRLVPADPGSIFETNPGEVWSNLVENGKAPRAGQRLETRAGERNSSEDRWGAALSGRALEGEAS